MGTFTSDSYAPPLGRLEKVEVLSKHWKHFSLSEILCPVWGLGAEIPDHWETSLGGGSKIHTALCFNSCYHFLSKQNTVRTHARHTGSLLTRVVSKWPRESLGLFQAKTLILGGRQITPQTPSTTAVRTSHSFKHSKKTSSHLQRPTHRGTVRLALQWRWIGGRVIS